MENSKIIQDYRKKNLRFIIDRDFNGSVIEFSNRINKHKVFVYGLLWETSNPNSRNITDKTARFIERALSLPTNVLDLVPSHNAIKYKTIFIPFISIADSESLNSLTFSDETIPFSEEIINSQNTNIKELFAYKLHENCLSNFKINDIFIINKNKENFISNKIYFIRFNHHFGLRKLTRVSDNNLISVSIVNHNLLHENPEVICNLDEVEIIGKPILSINYL